MSAELLPCPICKRVPHKSPSDGRLTHCGIMAMPGDWNRIPRSSSAQPSECPRCEDKGTFAAEKYDADFDLYMPFTAICDCKAGKALKAKTSAPSPQPTGKPIQRYDFEPSIGGCGVTCWADMPEKPEGKYVLYADHQAQLAEAVAENKRVEAKAWSDGMMTGLRQTGMDRWAAKKRVLETAQEWVPIYYAILKEQSDDWFF